MIKRSAAVLSLKWPCGRLCATVTHRHWGCKFIETKRFKLSTGTCTCTVDLIEIMDSGCVFLVYATSILLSITIRRLRTAVETSAAIFLLPLKTSKRWPRQTIVSIQSLGIRRISVPSIGYWNHEHNKANSLVKKHHRRSSAHCYQVYID